MSLFDKLPLDITEIIYKASLVEHVENFHRNFMKFHLKIAQRHYTYEPIEYENIDDFFIELRRLTNIAQYCLKYVYTHTYIQKQGALFYTYSACKLTDLNINLLKQHGHDRFLQISKDKMEELYTTMDMFWVLESCRTSYKGF